MKVKHVCPLGAECETAHDNVVHRCRWYVNVIGNDPQTGEHMDQWRCSMEWLPVLLVEGSMYERQTGAAVESLRNTIVRAKEEAATRISGDNDPRILEKS